MDWLKALVLGALQAYIYEQGEQVVAWLKKLGAEWVQPDGTIVVPPDDVVPFTKTLLKALCSAIRHGMPPQ